MINKPTLLYVDDEKANVLLFKVNFRNSFNLITASSGAEALEILANNNEISTVVSDLRMPGMTGVQLLIKAKELKPELNFFILSGIAISDEVSDLLNRNVLTGYFCKPISMGQVESKLKSLYE